ncbi:hypothetical protein D3C72_1476050 [compost metagenome]
MRVQVRRDMAPGALINCICCAFRLLSGRTRLLTGSFRSHQHEVNNPTRQPAGQFAWDPCHPLFVDAGFLAGRQHCQRGLADAGAGVQQLFSGGTMGRYRLPAGRYHVDYCHGPLGGQDGAPPPVADGDCSVHPGVRIVCYCAGHLAIVGGARCSRFGSGRHDGNDHGAGW